MTHDGTNTHSTNAELIERRDRALPKGLPSKSGVYAERAEGAELWDVEGKRYIDFIGGIGVLNAGHRHPKVVEAIKAQTDKFLHTAFGIAQYEVYVELAERLNALAPGSTPKKTAFFNSGAEAVENAVKFSRHITRRPGVIAFEGAFHGRTLLATALTGKAKPYKVGFGPFPPGIFHAPYPSVGMSAEGCLTCLDHIFKTEISPEDVAAIIVEPVQGEGGFNPAPAEFLQGLRKICDDNGIYLIADEIQTGYARTGRMFAMEHSGVEPDFLCIAKSIAAGLPLSAVIGRADEIDKVAAGAMGSTYGGNPVACAAALAVLDVIEEEGLVGRANKIGAEVEATMRGLMDDLPGAIGDVRRLGGMAAMELSHDGDLKRPNSEAAPAIVAEARSRGLITTTAGSHAQVVRTLIPLTISDALLKEGLEILSDATRAVVGPA
ncbi:MAG: 4-aminobutyrate--2-oxoglutarate transaminase [Pseudomonadota bacterium]